MRFGAAITTGVGVLNALSAVKQTILADSADVNILVTGDSTSAQDARIVKPLATYLAGLYPAYTVVYVPPDGAGGVTTPVTIQTGSGSHTLRLYNQSWSGSKTWSKMGAAFDAAFVTPGYTWDAVIWNFGKNQIFSGVTQPVGEGEFIGAIMKMQLAFPNARHLVIDQYPNRDDSLMDLSSTCWQDLVARVPEISRLNLKTGATYVSGDYIDNPHLTDVAYAAKIDPLVRAYWDSTAAADLPAVTPLLSRNVANLMDGSSGEKYGDFSLNGNGTNPGAANTRPGGYVSSGTMTFAQEGSIVYPGKSRSQKMTAGGASQTRILRTVSAAALAVAQGKSCFLTVVQYVAAGATGTVGRIGFWYNSGGTTYNTNTETDSQGAWRVKCIGPVPVPANASDLQGVLYNDSAASPDTTHPVYQQAVFISTDLPAGML